MTSSALKPRSAYRHSRERLAAQDDQKRRVLMSIRWRSGDDHAPSEEDIVFMAAWNAYAVNYFDSEGEPWWAFFSMNGTSLSAKRLDM